ncbi:hypothetical protein B0J12DRAFT_402987 [Macrophomina phaseolina]|uniref:Uncharacterized protein n=1 Tax=Macrophomina phaseolina TaxID=35725 RepID=A0ABQ8GIH1_9PEZI|nr:hypothetical protein B0J12DRAFT_402987 [Macrophomina phaseolina]
MRQLGRHRISKQSFGFERNARLDRSMPHRRSSDVANAVWLISEWLPFPGYPFSCHRGEKKKFVFCGRSKKLRDFSLVLPFSKRYPPSSLAPPSSALVSPVSPTGLARACSEAGWETRINLPLPLSLSLLFPAHPGSRYHSHITSPMRTIRPALLPDKKRRLPRVDSSASYVLGDGTGSFDCEVASALVMQHGGHYHTFSVRVLPPWHCVLADQLLSNTHHSPSRFPLN